MTSTHHVPPFSRVLYGLRAELALTQKDVADRMTNVTGLHWNMSTISRLESGLRHPRPETVLAIADALNLVDRDRFALFAAARLWENAPTDEQVDRVWDAIATEVAA